VWWLIKVACGLLLAGHFIAFTLGLYATRPLIVIPLPVAQVFVVLGAAITLSHYVILKRATRLLARPARLVVDGGLFSLVRHPMYFGDLIMYAGLAMLTGDLAAVVLAILGAVAIVQQCKIEDRALSERFKSAHERWKSSTRLIVPWLL
jgi:protein-S-isoprenylcysteine O-methyltransferase Ste14